MKTPIKQGIAQGDVDFNNFKPTNADLSGYAGTGLAWNTTNKQFDSDGGASTVTVSVKDPPYNATGDGVTDDTTAIQSAITAVWNAGGGTVFFPAGVYLCNGAFDATTNSILKIPFNSHTNPSKVIVLLGESGPNFNSYVFNGTGGAVIKSTKTGTGTRPALLAGAAYVSDGGLAAAEFNFTILYIRNMGFNFANNPTIDGLRLGEMAWASLTNVCAITGDGGSTEPTGGTIGIVMPNSNNFGMSFCSRTLSQGFDTGYKVGEHWMASNVTSAFAKIGLKLMGGYHVSAGTMVLQECAKHIVVVGDHPIDFTIDFEDGNIGGGNWFDTTVNVDDPSSWARGIIRYQQIKQNVGFVDTPLVVNGGTRIRYVNLYHSPDIDAGDRWKFVDPTDVTKKIKFDLSGITTGTTRTIKPLNANSTTVPAGGTTGQVLKKLSNADYDIGWG